MTHTNGDHKHVPLPPLPPLDVRQSVWKPSFPILIVGSLASCLLDYRTGMVQNKINKHINAKNTGTIKNIMLCY